MHDTPQHAGVAERRNRTIAECIRVLLHASGLPKSLLGEAARHVVWLLNRMTTKAVDGMTPYEAAFGKKLNLSGVREWGDKVWVRVEAGDKLGGRVKEGRWMGIDEQSKGVRVYWPDKRNVTIERNIYYDETCTSVSRFEGEDWDGFVEIETKPDSPNSKIPDTDPLKPNAPPPDNEIPPINQVPDPEPSSAAEESTSEVETRPKCIRKPRQKVRDLLEGRATTSTRSGDPLVARGVQLPTPNANDEVFEGVGQSDWMMLAESEEEYALVAEISEMEALEPRSLAEAKSRPDWPLWEKAIEEELALLKAAGTWKLVNAPEGANIIGSKWVFRAKKDASGNIV